MITAEMTWISMAVPMVAWVEIDARDHDQPADGGDEAHHRVDQDLDAVDRHAGEARRLAVAADRPHVEAEAGVVEEPGAEEGEQQGEHHRHRQAERCCPGRSR